MYFVEQKPRFEPLCKEGESTRNEQYMQARLPCSLHEPFGARVELQLLFVDCVQDVGRQAAQKCHPTRQAFGKILDLAAHRGLGDRGDLFLHAPKRRDLVDALVDAESRVDVEADGLGGAPGGQDGRGRLSLDRRHGGGIRRSELEVEVVEVVDGRSIVR